MRRYSVYPMGSHFSQLLNKTFNGSAFYSSGRSSQPVFTDLGGSESSPAFKLPHSNSFVDVNSDGNADIFVTATDAIELWANLARHTAGSHFRK